MAPNRFAVTPDRVMWPRPDEVADRVRRANDSIARTQGRIEASRERLAISHAALGRIDLLITSLRRTRV